MFKRLVFAYLHLFFGAILCFPTNYSFTHIKADASATDTQTSTNIISSWNAGNIISDGLFWKSGYMTQQQIQDFLNQKGTNCKKNGSVECIKNYKVNVPTRKKDEYCVNSIAKETNVSAARAIALVSYACNINEQVILVSLQKEQGLILTTKPTASAYKYAMGMGCPDSGSCDSKYYGFFNQIYSAARQFNIYRIKDNYGKRPNASVKIMYSPNVSCGSKSVFIENWATAALYIYTPYQPNKASLNAGYGTGNKCSSYGNRNFYLYFNDWFGNSHELPMNGAGVKLQNSVRLKSKVLAQFNWNIKNVTLKYKWYLNDKKIKGYTKKSYTPKLANLGKYLYAKVVASKPGYRTTTYNTKKVKVKKATFLTRIIFSKSPKKYKTINPRIKDLPVKTSVSYKWYVKKSKKDKQTKMGTYKQFYLTNYKYVKLVITLSKKHYKKTKVSSTWRTTH
jgi:hypothetical protein